MEPVMRIWVDADACPAAVKEIVIRSALRLGVETLFVSDKFVRLPASPLLRYVAVLRGPDAADDQIAADSAAGDLAVTQDIPLAARLVAKGVSSIDPRGDVHTPSSIGERLSLRNFMEDLRGAGVTTPGPSGFGPRDTQRFANALDRELTRLRK
jgi:hypothetical protein